MIRIVLADHHSMVRAGLGTLLNAVVDFEVVAEAASAEETLQAARDLQPDVVLLDVDMPGIGGPESTRRLLRIVPGVHVIGVSEHQTGPYPMHIFEAGAVGYLSKSGRGDELERAVRTVMYGKRYLNGDVARNLLLQRWQGEQSPLSELSRRELEVLIQLSKARNLRDIAQALSISPKTVSTYRTRVCRKLGVSSDVELAHVALRYGLLNPATV
jgi:two-component system invasion response regulator UvrY